MTAVSASGTSTTELVYKRLPLIERSLMRPSLMFLFIPRNVSLLLQEQMVWQKFLCKLSLLYNTYLWLLNHDSYCTILCTIISFHRKGNEFSRQTHLSNQKKSHPHPSYVVISILCLMQSLGFFLPSSSDLIPFPDFTDSFLLLFTLHRHAYGKQHIIMKLKK